MLLEEGANMSERQSESVAEWLEIDLGKLSAIDRVGLINEVMDTLTAQELGVVRENADKKRQSKLKDARSAFLTEVREKAQQLDLSLEDVLEMDNQSRSQPKRQRRERGPIQVKYRGPEGEEWSGRGRAPRWLKNLEAAEHNRDEYLVQPEG